MEAWADVFGFDYHYQVSDKGNVRNMNYRKDGNIRVLKTSTHNKGYLRVGLLKDGKQKNVRVHRLVAISFIKNPNSLEQVNHIDENKTNNEISNLEWVNNKQNSNHGTKPKRIADRHRELGTYQALAKLLSKPVRGVSALTGDSFDYPSIRSTKERGFNPSKVSNVLSGRSNTHKGFKWSYIDKKGGI